MTKYDETAKKVQSFLYTLSSTKEELKLKKSEHTDLGIREFELNGWISQEENKIYHLENNDNFLKRCVKRIFKTTAIIFVAMFGVSELLLFSSDADLFRQIVALITSLFTSAFYGAIEYHYDEHIIKHKDICKTYNLDEVNSKLKSFKEEMALIPQKRVELENEIKDLTSKLASLEKFYEDNCEVIEYIIARKDEALIEFVQTKDSINILNNMYENDIPYQKAIATLKKARNDFNEQN